MKQNQQTMAVIGSPSPASPLCGGAGEVSPFPLDLGRVLYDLASSFNPLHRDFLLDYHVTGVRDGHVYLAVALPEGMTRVFVSLLESLTGFVRFIDTKSRTAVAEAKAIDPVRIQSVHQMQDEFRDLICSTFDEFVSQGLPVNDAVKRTNSSLKASGHPWATHETVKTILRSSGRFRKRKGVIS